MNNGSKPANRKSGYYVVQHRARDEKEIAYYNPHFFWQFTDSRKHFNDDDLTFIGHCIELEKPEEPAFSKWQNDQLKKYAFPGNIMGLIGDNEQLIPVNGLTKREMFAMAAMQGLIASTSWGETEGNIGHASLTAELSVMYADELLKALES